jgi:polyisoprenoid-binding protein YceI
MPCSLRYALVVAALVALPVQALADPNERAIDTAASKATFSVQHVFVERVTGTVPITSGSVILAAGAMIPTSATAVLDATKVSTGDDDRDGSLESPDFFEAKKFPRWTFVSTKIVPHANGSFEMDGTLEVHGVTQPEQLDVTVTGDAAHPRYHAVGHIDRKAFGMSVSRLDPVIGNPVDITLDIVLRPRSAS